jgi:hypothetical protein
VIVGRIYQNDGTSLPGARWFWALNGAAGEALQHGIRGSGLAPSLDAAKGAWREAYDRWLEIKDLPDHNGELTRSASGMQIVVMPTNSEIAELQDLAERFEALRRAYLDLEAQYTGLRAVTGVTIENMSAKRRELALWAATEAERWLDERASGGREFGLKLREIAAVLIRTAGKRRGGLNAKAGGIARAKALSSEERREIGKRAARARWLRKPTK